VRVGSSASRTCRAKVRVTVAGLSGVPSGPVKTSPCSSCLADDNVELLRQAANEIAAEWTDREAARLLLDAAIIAEIGA